MISTISASELRKGLETYLLIDVREPDEFAESHIPSSINIPLAKFIEDLEANKLVIPVDKKLVLICRSGNRSRIAAEACNQKGILAVNLTGGILAWRALT